MVDINMFTIEYSKGIKADLKNVRAFERKQILDGIDNQLKNEPNIETRNRKS